MSTLFPNAQEAYFGPDAEGFYGPYGGRFVPETVMPALLELTVAYEEAREDETFLAELTDLYVDYVGRETPLYSAKRLAEAVGLGRVLLKREDLCHTGAHKINNTLGQCLLAKRMGKKRVIAETGAGQHGVATATTAALMGLECAVFMGVEDIRRQSLNVYKMRLLGAEVIPVAEGSGTLANAVTAALRHWVERVEDTFYVLGSAVGPHPYPLMVRDFQSVIGNEIIAQLAEKNVGHVDAVCACVGGGSNAIGTFFPFVSAGEQFADTELVGAEAVGGLPRRAGLGGRVVVRVLVDARRLSCADPGREVEVEDGVEYVALATAAHERRSQSLAQPLAVVEAEHLHHPAGVDRLAGAARQALAAQGADHLDQPRADAVAHHCPPTPTAPTAPTSTPHMLAAPTVSRLSAAAPRRGRARRGP